MCGICGAIGLSEPGLAEAAVRAMLAAMVHRGPDDEGLSVAESLALGMRRLSIIDLAGGHQPVFNEDGAVAVGEACWMPCCFESPAATRWACEYEPVGPCQSRGTSRTELAGPS